MVSVKGIEQIPKVLSGIGKFILPCKRIEILYCEWMGSSKGLKDFLENDFAAYAKSNPEIEFAIGNRPGRQPILRGRYTNGREKTICVRKSDRADIKSMLDLLRNCDGSKLRRVTRGRFVESENSSVRGIWSPMHGNFPKI